MTPQDDRLLAFAHIGDLHITDAKQQNFRDFLAIAAQIEIDCAAALDFVVLPGDNADNGKPAQYRLVSTGLKLLTPPVHAIPGDHDMEQGGLDAFRAHLSAAPLPRALTLRGVRCLFLDISGPGSGGPDFRIGASQLAWLGRELDGARQRGETAAIFMHTYPDDLTGAGETEAVNRLIAEHDVALVDIGHTHYNEIANDGRTIFAATRSTGQIEEGPVGYAIVAIDAGIVSWRFKPLDDAFPFVAITSPADHRLMRGSGHAVAGQMDVRALVLGHRAIRRVACRIGDGEWTGMTRPDGARHWTARLPVPEQGALVSLTVRATDEAGRPGEQTIVAATRAHIAPLRPRLGSDAASIGAWPENGILGTQLGPNRNGGPV